MNRFRRIAEDLVVGGGNIGRVEQVLAKDLAGLEFRRGLAGTEDPQAFCLEGIDDSRGQGGLRADDGQAHVVVAGEADQGRKIVGLDRHILAVDVRAGIARGDENAVRPRALRDLPGQGVFPAAVADNEDIHVPDSRRVLNQAILAQPLGRGKGRPAKNGCRIDRFV